MKEKYDRGNKIGAILPIVRDVGSAFWTKCRAMDNSESSIHWILQSKHFFSKWLR